MYPDTNPSQVVETLADVTARVRISISHNGHPRRQLPPLTVPTTKDAARDPNGMSFKWEGKRYICLCLSVDARAVMQKEGRFEIEYAYCCGDVETSRTRTVTVGTFTCVRFFICTSAWIFTYATPSWACWLFCFVL